MALRGEGMATRKERQAKFKQGPGVFEYLGGAVAVQQSPTVKRRGYNEPRLSADGMPVLDGSGRQVYEKRGAVVTDLSGRPVLGGAPEISTVEIETWTIRGVTFAKGKPVQISDESLAIKLRGNKFFKEIESVAIKVVESPEAAPEAAPVVPQVEASGPDPAPAPKRRGRPPKSTEA